MVKNIRFGTIVFMNVRYFVANDYPTVRRNLEEAEVFYEGRDSEENYIALIDQDPGSVLVATIDGEVVGSMVGQRFGQSLAILWSLGVAEKYRRQGVATELMTVMERNLKDKGVKEIWSFIDVTNLASQALVRQLGHQINTDHKYFGPHKEL